MVFSSVTWSLPCLFFGFPFYFFHLLLWSCRGNWNCPLAWWSAVWSSVRITLCWSCWLITILVWLTERYYILLLRTVIRNAFSLWMSTPLCCLCSWFFATLMLDLFAYVLDLLTFFTRESSYCFHRVLAIAILSVCHMGGSGKNGPNRHRRLPGRH